MKEKELKLTHISVWYDDDVEVELGQLPAGLTLHLPSSLSLNDKVCVYNSLNSQKRQLVSNGDFIEMSYSNVSIHMISVIYTIYLPGVPVDMLFSCSKFMQSYFFSPLSPCKDPNSMHCC